MQTKISIETKRDAKKKREREDRGLSSSVRQGLQFAHIFYHRARQQQHRARQHQADLKKLA
jgi:hypothetical protein